MIPLKLRLTPMEVSPDGKKKIIYVLELVLEGDWTKFLPGRGDVLSLPAPIPTTSMPTKADLDREIPEDLMPRGGEALGDQVGDPEPPKVKQKPVEDPVAAARAVMERVQDTEEDPEGHGNSDPQEPPDEEERQHDPEEPQEPAPPNVRKKEVRKADPNWKTKPKAVQKTSGRTRKKPVGRLF